MMRLCRNKEILGKNMKPNKNQDNVIILPVGLVNVSSQDDMTVCRRVSGNRINLFVNADVRDNHIEKK
jgi:hypothetical protein